MMKQYFRTFFFDPKNIRSWCLVCMTFGYLTVLSGCATNPQARPNVTAGPDSFDGQTQQVYRQALSDLEEGRSGVAAESLEQLAQANPDVTEVWLNLALAFYRENDRDRAEQTVDRILARWPDTAPACNLAGLLALQAGEFEAAEKRFGQALQIDPDYVNALYNMALLKDVYLQDLSGAIHFYQQYLVHAADDEATAQWLEELRQTLGQEARP